MNTKPKPRVSLFDFMAGPKDVSTPKYEALRHGEEQDRNLDGLQTTNDVSFDHYAYKRSHHFLVICIGVCLSCLIFSLIILGTTGILLRDILNQANTDYQHALSLVSNERWVAEDSDSQGLTWPDSGSQGCGHSPSEAITQGCKFDVMTTSWQHPDCYDEELNTEFMALHSPWPFYWSSGPPDEQPTTETRNLIPLEELGFYEGTFWGTREYHIWHCTYAWRQMHRAVENGRKLDAFLQSYEHTAHCGRLIINATTSDHSKIALDAVVTRATIKYPLC